MAGKTVNPRSCRSDVNSLAPPSVEIRAFSCDSLDHCQIFATA